MICISNHTGCVCVCLHRRRFRVHELRHGQVRNGYICNIDRRLPGLRRGQLLGSSRCVALFSAILIHISHNMHLCIQRPWADECSGKLCTCFVSQITHKHALFTCMTCPRGSVFVRTSLFGLVLFLEAQNKFCLRACHARACHVRVCHAW